MLCYAAGSLTTLSVSLLLVGFLFGSTTALVAVNVADIFGEKYIATNYGFIGKLFLANTVNLKSVCKYMYMHPCMYMCEYTYACNLKYM